VPSIVADVDSRGQLRAIVSFYRRTPWGRLWAALEVEEKQFPDLGVVDTDSDLKVWRAAQAHGALLLTGNRNQSGTDSLEAVLRRENSPACLPVVTLGDAKRMMADRQYFERAAIRLIEIVMDLDQYCGTGRVYIP